MLFDHLQLASCLQIAASITKFLSHIHLLLGFLIALISLSLLILYLKENAFNLSFVSHLSISSRNLFIDSSSQFLFFNQVSFKIFCIFKIFVNISENIFFPNKVSPLHILFIMCIVLSTCSLLFSFFRLSAVMFNKTDVLSSETIS